jgi:hypothetical protein
MTNAFPMDSFTEAYHEAYRYPSQGKRIHHDGVPSRPTLAYFAAKEALGYNPFDSPIRSNTQQILAIITKLATKSERSISEIVSTAADKDTLKDEARAAVFDGFPEAEEILSENAFSEINYTGPILVAICAVSYDIDPIKAIRRSKDGETRYRTGS